LKENFLTALTQAGACEKNKSKKFLLFILSFSLSFKKVWNFSIAAKFLWFCFSNAVKRKILKNDTTHSRAYKHSRKHNDVAFERENSF
jgi:hypothetical protein